MARIAIAGFLHETNTFVQRHTDMDAFVTADAWPGLVRGSALFEAVAGANLAISGFIKEAAAHNNELFQFQFEGDTRRRRASDEDSAFSTARSERGSQHSSTDKVELVPLLWTSANPSGPVTQQAYENIWAMLKRELEQALPIDALFLDLHGAMVAEHIEDGEGELLQRIRAIIGPGVPIVAALDFHANISPRMVALADAMTVYRTYPHVDMSDTGRRAAIVLQRILAGEHLHKTYRQIPFLIPLPWQCTSIEPLASLMQLVDQQEHKNNVSAAIVPGFPLADIYDCGPTVLAYGADAAATEAVAQRLFDAMLAQRAAFNGKLYSAADAVSHALAGSGEGPVILADTQDNPGGGAAGDTTDILHELVRQRAPDACVGLLCDPAAAAAAHAAGVGATKELVLGAHSGIGAAPLVGKFIVEALGNGRFSGTGPFYLGCRMNLGPMARLRLNGIQILVSTHKQQAADQAMFRHLGVDPARQRILVLKSSVHFRADFAGLAREILIVAAAGDNVADLAQLHYQKLRPGVSVSS